MKDPILAPPPKGSALDDKKKIYEVPPNLEYIIGLKEHGKEAGVENVIKQLSNGHALLMVKRIRVKGYCVSCIKKVATPNFKKVLQKVVTHCPACPGGIWICEPCFNTVHNIKS